VYYKTRNIIYNKSPLDEIVCFNGDYIFLTKKVCYFGFFAVILQKNRKS